MMLKILCIAAPLVGGMISAWFSGDQMSEFGQLNQPALSPPAWIFPVVWSILYIMLGIVLLLLVRSDYKYKTAAISLFISQLIMNYLWSPVFFVHQDYVQALIILVLMLTTTVILTIITWKNIKLAGMLLIPYILWLSFATYLNIGVGMLNA